MRAGGRRSPRGGRLCKLDWRQVGRLREVVLDGHLLERALRDALQCLRARAAPVSTAHALHKQVYTCGRGWRTRQHPLRVTPTSMFIVCTESSLAPSASKHPGLPLCISARTGTAPSAVLRIKRAVT